MTLRVLEQILGQFGDSPAIDEIIQACRRDSNNVVVSNLKGGSSAALLAAMQARAERPVLVLTSTLERAESLCDGIAFFGGTPHLFPPLETLPFEIAEPALHIAATRSEALHALVKKPQSESAPPLLHVAPVDALLHRIQPREALERQGLEISWGQQFDIDDLALRLVDMGYVRESMVESPGEFSIRGSILDVYPPEADLPARLDFFGDEVESIRQFDPSTQRSEQTARDIESVRILARADVGPTLDCLLEGKPLSTLLDLFPPETLVVMDGPGRLDQRIEYFQSVAERHWEEIQAKRKKKDDAEEQDDEFEDDAEDDFGPRAFPCDKFSPADWIVAPEEVRTALARWPSLRLIDLAVEADDALAARSEVISVGAQGFESVTPNFKEFVELIREKQHDGYRIAIVCDNPGQEMRLDELLAEHQISAVLLDVPEPTLKDDKQNGSAVPPPEEARPRVRLHAASASDVAILQGQLPEGFIFAKAKLIVLTDREMFGRYKRRRIYRKAHRGRAVADPTEISRGDFVVHQDHGIGLFEKIRKQSIDGRMCEFLDILYGGEDRLLLPVDKLHLVQKYSASDGRTPTLDRLGQKKWAKRRKKTADAVHKLAGELLELYARREASHRPPHDPDTVWQQEFEASFVYQETPDQLRAIQDVKSDLCSDRPTDRLICGDVGYGKTEVAIRAAFKVLVEKKQVAVLVPTTILALQHYRTFSERLADYPFRVGMVSRFKKAAENRATLEALTKGEIDLIIGTHRLLSKDVKFQDLGLLVIDEEQRFGVQQKEKIKAFKPSVDVITLTATPIPRTLHLALARLRDLSIIQTPPADRLPIRTRTIHFEPEQIEEAILRELNRGGQIFFIHNRIGTIQEVADSIREIVPQVRLAIGHGQTDERELEQIMIDFIDGKYDILLSTTIIENGIDIPNVNTIIINRADAFGLAQLYQLRGRVGRDVRQAYAYLIVPQGKPITDAATKRLSALEEFTELGMGFNIAMRDMEIRGTGNILGKEQSGAISDVGFDLYCQLLEEAVQELKGEATQEPLWQTEVKWPAEQWLPEEYIPIESQRIRFYRELASAREVGQIELIEDELIDRYGALPPESKLLLAGFRIKLAFAAWHADTVRYDGAGHIRIKVAENPKALAEALSRATRGADWIDRIAFRPDGMVIAYVDHDENAEGLAERYLDEFGKMALKLGTPIDVTASPAVTG